MVKILIDDLEEGRKSSINVLQGIRMAHKAWESVEKLTIAYCFATCGFAERPNILITENVCLQDSEEWLILKKHFTNLPERFDDFVNFDDNITFTGSLTDDDIITGVTKPQDNGEQEDEKTEEIENIVAAREAKIIVRKLQTFFEAQDSTPQNTFHSLASVEKNIDGCILNLRKQTQITQYFTKM